MRLLLGLLGACLVGVQATSQGVSTTTCDPWDNIGCLTWDSGNRLNCTDPTHGPMPWALKPLRSTAYSIRTADGPPSSDPTSYVPGTMTTIYVRALVYGMQFRGILLTAFAGKNTTVGSWVFPSDDQALFWSPPLCPQSAMHNSATPKPALSLLRFMAPPAGTGTITIRCLLKRGAANDGFFNFPAVDLVLSEGSAQSAWFAANAGETCDSCCLRNGRSGSDLSAQKGLFSASAFSVATEKEVLCNLPLLTSCSPAAPVIDEHNFCYMRESNCTPTWRSTAPVANARNLCACVVSPASALAINHWVMGLLAGLTALTSQKRHLFLYLLVACALMPSVRAHNWLHTPGRASTQASTVFPCQGRKATDLHAQLSRSQTFVTKWAVGHDRDSYFVLVNEKDQDMLARDDFEAMVDDYLARGTQAPYNSPNLANDPTWMRYHGTYFTDSPLSNTYTPYNDQSQLPGSLFSGQVMPGDANYLTHPRSNQTFYLYSYTTAARASDIRLEYASMEYPWIEMAFRAPHLYHLPGDFNSFRTRVPGRSNDGHYILHWRWSGYFDCIDIDLRASNVPAVYGVDSPGYIYNRIDHCQYLTPRQLVTPCVEVGWDAESCLARLPSWMVDNRLGVNVVPFVNPSTVYKGFKDVVNIPWGDGVCSDNSWMELHGTVTETPIDFNNAAVFKVSKSVGQKCTSTMQPCEGGAGVCALGSRDYVPRDEMLNFKRAVALCVGNPRCKGLSIERDNSLAAGALPTDAGLHHIVLCLDSAATSAAANWTTVTPSGLSTYTDFATQTTKTYSFVPARFGSALGAPAANQFRDYGAPYANQMGWTCNTSVNCDWCCASYDCDNQGPTAGDPTAYRTFNWMQGFCPGQNVYRQWEVAMTAGVYDVTLHSDTGTTDPNAWISGCNIEGALMQDGTDEPAQPALIRRRVEVLDGRLTLDGDAGLELGCNAVNYVTVTAVRALWDEVWLPAVSNPYWLLTLDSVQPIGVVQLNAINYYIELNGGSTRQLNCAAWWMFRGSKCFDGRPIGWFNGTNEGVIVGVSSTASPCGTNGCTGTVCGKITKAVDEWSIWNQYVDCKGAMGKYVWAYLPGSQRSLVFNVRVFRAVPVVPPERLNTTKVCYGVEAHPQTATNPEFTIVTDPEDPIFYSTCYARERNITWLGPSLSSAPVARWRFNQHCLDCATYKHNAQTLDWSEIPAPWQLADGGCANCDTEGTPAPLSKTVLPWRFTYQGSCDVSRNNCTANAPSCLKQLAMGGRDAAVNDDWTQQIMSEVDCQLLAERDSECQPVAQFQRGWWDGKFIDYRRACYCWRKSACCGRCAPWYGNVPYEGSEIYTTENSVNPDPTCSTGVKSTDNTMCCKSYCQDSSGNSVCGSATPSNNDCYSKVEGGGGCCSTNTVQKCTDAGPPCLLT